MRPGSRAPGSIVEWRRMEGRDAVESLLAAFDRANLVALGERHWVREDSQFRMALLRHPAFAATVNDIVVEFANPVYQEVLDRFVDGEPVAVEEVPRVWRDTTQPGAFDSPVYEQFLNAVRDRNGEVRRDQRVRVLAADSPIDWAGISAPADLDEATRGRDRFAATVIRREVLDRGRRALAIFGAAHVCRNRAETIVDRLKEDGRARWFIVAPIGGPGLPAAITAHKASVRDPALMMLAGSPVGRLPAGEVLEIGTRRIKTVDGRSVFRTGSRYSCRYSRAGFERAIWRTRVCILAKHNPNWWNHRPGFMTASTAQRFDGVEAF